MYYYYGSLYKIVQFVCLLLLLLFVFIFYCWVQMYLLGSTDRHRIPCTCTPIPLLNLNWVRRPEVRDCVNAMNFAEKNILLSEIIWETVPPPIEWQIQVTMIVLLLMTLIAFPNQHHAAPDEGLAEPACRTLRRFEQSLKSAVTHNDSTLCKDSQPQSKPSIFIIP